MTVCVATISNFSIFGTRMNFCMFMKLYKLLSHYCIALFQTGEIWIAFKFSLRAVLFPLLQF